MGLPSLDRLDKATRRSRRPWSRSILIAVAILVAFLYWPRTPSLSAYYKEQQQQFADSVHQFLQEHGKGKGSEFALAEEMQNQVRPYRATSLPIPTGGPQILKGPSSANGYDPNANGPSVPVGTGASNGLYVGAGAGAGPSSSGDLAWKPLITNSSVSHAHLTLPLDYNNPSAGTFEVALNKLSATSPKGKLGSILINPGGPGGSGTGFLYTRGPEIMNSTGGRFDIIGFDPRGVNGSIQFDCFEGDTTLRDALKRQNPPLAYAHEAAIGHELAYKKLQGTICSANDLGKHVSTALVATDMLHISRALGDPKLNYWGFSYGSVLGNTFAQLFPESVGRIIVDGVVDGHDYYLGQWTSNLVDAEAVESTFYSNCSISSDCALNGTAKAIRKSVYQLLDRIRIEPLPVYHKGSPGPRSKSTSASGPIPGSGIVDEKSSEPNTTAPAVGFLTYSMVKNALFGALYTPRQWPKLADALNDAISHDDGLKLFEKMWDVDVTNEDDGGYATRCGDSVRSPLTGKLSTVEELKARLKKMESASKVFGENWISIPCQNYHIKPTTIWDGPFRQVNASALLISTTFDPVTPLRSAHKMAQYYSNSAVLEQRGIGHSSLAQPSTCTNQIIQDWLEHGILPPPGTVCDNDCHDNNAFECEYPF